MSRHTLERVLRGFWNRESSLSDDDGFGADDADWAVYREVVSLRPPSPFPRIGLAARYLPLDAARARHPRDRPWAHNRHTPTNSRVLFSGLATRMRGGGGSVLAVCAPGG